MTLLYTQYMKKIWFVIGAVALLLVVAGLFSLGDGGEAGKMPKLSQGGCEEADSDPIFTADITDFSLVDFIVPPGSIVNDLARNDVLKTHSFVVVKDTAPIYAPIDSVLNAGTNYMEEDMEQFSLFFEVNCDLFYIMDHVLVPSEKVRQAFNDLPQNTTESKTLAEPIEFKAGELIGYSKGTLMAHHWDFGVYRKSERNFLTDSDRSNVFPRDTQAVCPYDFFPPEMKERYYKVFGNLLTDQPVPTTFCSK